MPCDGSQETAAEGSAALRLVAGVRALRTTGTKPGIFWAHFMNFDLARCLGNDQPFYSVALTHDDVARLGNNVTCEQIAACIADKMCAALPNGPYILGGYSVGAILAYAVASQLLKLGSEVPLLILFEPMWPARHFAVSRTKHTLVYTRYLARLGYRNTYYAMHRLRRLMFAIPGERRSMQHLFPGQDLIETAVRRYRPSVYPGSVQLVLSSQEHPLAWSPSMWKHLIPRELDVSYINCYHDDLVKPPYASSIAEIINQRIAALTTHAVQGSGDGVDDKV